MEAHGFICIGWMSPFQQMSAMMRHPIYSLIGWGAGEVNLYFPLCSIYTRGSIAHDTSGELAKVFVNGTIPSNVQSYLALQHYVAHNNPAHNSTHLPRTILQSENMSVAEEATALFTHLNYLLDPACINDKSQFWYRQPDGRCNWLKAGQSHIGSTGYPRSRDWGHTMYADGISRPREGPNPREVSNAFFKVSTWAAY